jgi:hypothetical protein
VATIPGTLTPADQAGTTTSTPNGSGWDFTGGDKVDFNLGAGSSPGTYQFSAVVDAPDGAVLYISIDGGAPVAAIRKGDGMLPAHSAVEVDVALTGSAVQLDDAGSGRGAPANRNRVRVINPTSSSVIVYVGRSQAGANASTAEPIEANGGIWEDEVDASVTIWARTATGSLTVRFIQYATA